MVALAFLVVGGQVLALLAASATLVVRDLVALAFLVVGGQVLALLAVAVAGRRWRGLGGSG